MPLILRQDLPAFDQLQAEGVFMMGLDRAAHQDIRPLEIGILNLMPDKLTTETQLLRLLASTPLQIHVSFLKTATYKPTHVEPGHLEKFYTTMEELSHGLDGIIITGAPIEHLDFSEVAYWEELKGILDWAKKKHVFVLGLCWGAQAVLNHYYGIDKHALPQKKFGVFRHEHQESSPLTMHMDDRVWVPHSRHTEVREEDIKNHPDLRALLVSPEAGLHLVSNQDDSVVCLFGHGEYDRETLEKEYKRDLDQGRTEVPLPENYYPDNNPEKTPYMNWRANGTLFFRNWITQVYEKTPYEIEK